MKKLLDWSRPLYDRMDVNTDPSFYVIWTDDTGNRCSGIIHATAKATPADLLERIEAGQVSQ